MPGATRLGDRETGHCSGKARAQASGNVFVNGIGFSRHGDKNTVHLLPGSPCPAHATPLISAANYVYVNGRLAGRNTDGTGCTPCSQGSPNVFVGSAP